MSVSVRECVFKLLKERIKQLIFRFFALGSLFLDLFLVYKKFIRGHWEWAVLSLVWLFLSSVAGSLYSLWWDVFEAHSKESSRKKKVRSDEPSFSYRALQYKEKVSVLEYDAESLHAEDSGVSVTGEGKDEYDIEEPSQKYTANKYTASKELMPRDSRPCEEKKFGRMISMTGSVYVEPYFLGPKQEEKLSAMPLHAFIVGIKELSFGMLISHCILFAKEYRIYEATQLLWKGFYSKEQDWEAHIKLEKQNVKKVSYDRVWNEYCRKELVSKQLSIVIAVIQTIPMTLIDLSYWSFKSEEISNVVNNDGQRFIAANFGGKEFNILELISLVLNLGAVAYRQIAVANQVRKINFGKEDMCFLHLVFLWTLYFFSVLSRVSAIYFVMCLNLSSVVFAISILLLQFLIMTLKDSESMFGVSKTQLTVSNILMLFLYIPAKNGIKSKSDISVKKYKYDIIMVFEMISFFTFVYIQLGDIGSSKIYLVGHKVQKAHYLVGCAVAFGFYILSLVLNTKCLIKKLFTYHRKLTNVELTRILIEVNETNHTNFKIITDQYGQDNYYYGSVWSLRSASNAVSI